MLMEQLKLKGTVDIFERKVGNEKWEHLLTQTNIITNVGYNILYDRLRGSGTYYTTTCAYFSVSNGVVTPTLTRTAANFLADGTTFTKAVTSTDAFVVGSLLGVWNCYLSSADNTVTSITKFALMNTLVPTYMFNECIFGAVSKDATKELYIRYKITLSAG